MMPRKDEWINATEKCRQRWNEVRRMLGVNPVEAEKDEWLIQWRKENEEANKKKVQGA